MRYFCNRIVIDDSAGVVVAKYDLRAWDGASTLFSDSGQIPVGIDDTPVDIKKNMIDYLATRFSAARKDIVLVD